jgi:hypothetical protein
MAAWTLTNITAGLSEHTRIVIEHGVVPLLVQLMSSSSDDIKEQVMSFSVSWHNCIEKPLCMYVSMLVLLAYTISMCHVLNRHYMGIR